jgi:hypothetical protein
MNTSPLNYTEGNEDNEGIKNPMAFLSDIQTIFVTFVAFCVKEFLK